MNRSAISWNVLDIDKDEENTENQQNPRTSRLVTFRLVTVGLDFNC